MSNPLSTLVTDELLTPEVLFAQPGLRPAPPSQFKFSPDGRYVTYLQGTLERQRRWTYGVSIGLKMSTSVWFWPLTSTPSRTRALPNSAMLSVPSASVNGNLPSASHTTSG